MTSRWQKIVLAAAAVLFVAYLIVRAREAGGPDEYAREILSPSSVPVLTSAPPRTAPAPASPAPAPAKPSSAPVPSDRASVALAAMNGERAAVGAAALATNAVLQAEAQRFASDMAARGFFDHTSPEGVTFQQRMAATAYPSGSVSENIGLTSSQKSGDVVQQWMNSPAHRANLLDASKRAVGIGVATGTYQGQTVLYMVAIFGDAR